MKPCRPNKAVLWPAVLEWFVLHGKRTRPMPGLSVKKLASVLAINTFVFVDINPRARRLVEFVCCEKIKKKPKWSDMVRDALSDPVLFPSSSSSLPPPAFVCRHVVSLALTLLRAARDIFYHARCLHLLRAGGRKVGGADGLCRAARNSAPVKIVPSSTPLSAQNRRKIDAAVTKYLSAVRCELASYWQETTLKIACTAPMTVDIENSLSALSEIKRALDCEAKRFVHRVTATLALPLSQLSRLSQPQLACADVGDETTVGAWLIDSVCAHHKTQSLLCYDDARVALPSPKAIRATVDEVLVKMDRAARTGDDMGRYVVGLTNWMYDTSMLCCATEQRLTTVDPVVIAAPWPKCHSWMTATGGQKNAVQRVDYCLNCKTVRNYKPKRAGVVSHFNDNREVCKICGADHSTVRIPLYVHDVANDIYFYVAVSPRPITRGRWFGIGTNTGAANVDNSSLSQRQHQQIGITGVVFACCQRRRCLNVIAIKKETLFKSIADDKQLFCDSCCASAEETDLGENRNYCGCKTCGRYRSTCYVA